MEILLGLSYFFLCAIVAYLGRGARVGPYGVFFISVLFTPILTLSGLLLLGSRKEP